jgi:hypothetical protein
MSAHTFGESISACPVCRRDRADRRSAVQRSSHLLTCSCCRSQLVVGLHGQFIRDPFVRRSNAPSGRQLRRQSSPLARLLRDVQPPLAVILGSALLLGSATSLLRTLQGRPPIPRTLTSLTFGPPAPPP